MSPRDDATRLCKWGAMAAGRRRRRAGLGALALLLALAAIAQAQGWLQRYGGAGSDRVAALAVRADGRLLAVGHTTSRGAGGRDAWLLDLNADGSVRGERTFGGAADDAFADVVALPDGGAVAVGFTNSFGQGGQDLWALHLGANDAVRWHTVYLGSGNNTAEAVVVLPDGDLVLAGSRLAGDGGNLDGWVLRLDAGGALRWHRTFGGPALDRFRAVATAPDGDLILAGETWSFGDGLADAWVVRLDGDGDVRWQRAYGGAGATDAAWAVQVEEGGDLVVAGTTGAFGAGGDDAWVLALDGGGAVRWSVAAGGPDADGLVALARRPGRQFQDAWTRGAEAALQGPAGQIVVAGTTESFGVGNGDIWLVGLEPDGLIGWQRTYGTPTDRDEATDVVARGDGTLLLAGLTAGQSAAGSDAWVLSPGDAGQLAGAGVSATESEATVTPVELRGVATEAEVGEPPLRTRSIDSESRRAAEFQGEVPDLPLPDLPDIPDNLVLPDFGDLTGPAPSADWMPLASLGLALGLIAIVSAWLWRRR